jgi:putative ABC transport system permease protein
MLSEAMASFLRVSEGDTIRVLLARATSEQIEVELKIVGLFERLPGFPDGADALMNIEQHVAIIPSTVPAFFLVQTSGSSSTTLSEIVNSLHNAPNVAASFQIDTRLMALAKDQSSLAALNISGLLKIDSAYALAMGIVTIAIFVFGLLLQRRREYVTLRAQGMHPAAIRTFIAAEAGTTAIAGSIIGVLVGLVMGYYFIKVLRPLFVLDPLYIVDWISLGTILFSVLSATIITSIAASALVNRLRATELLRDE